jgi:uncharacterized membrane protein
MLKFCNRYHTRVSVAIIYHRPNCPDGGDWAKKGWWNMSPGECKVSIGGDLTNRYYYFFAEASDGRFWAGRPPNPSVRTQAPRRVFDWCLNTGSTDSRILVFRRIDTGDYDDYTVNLH